MKKYLTSDFRHYVDIKSYGTLADDAGGRKPTYLTALSTTCKVEPYDGDLFTESGERVLNNKYAFIFRYRGIMTITKANKINFNSKDYIIHSVINEDQMGYYVRVIAYRRD